MKRTGLVCLMLALLAGALAAPAEAAKRAPRKVTREATGTYQLPWAGSPSTPVGGCVSYFGVGNACPSFPISGTERWVTMEVHDASGTATAFEILQITKHGLNVETTTVAGPLCGTTGKKPVELTPGLELLIRVYANGDVVCPGAVGTSGTVEAVFSNLP